MIKILFKGLPFQEEQTFQTVAEAKAAAFDFVLHQAAAIEERNPVFRGMVLASLTSNEWEFVEAVEPAAPVVEPEPALSAHEEIRDEAPVEVPAHVPDAEAPHTP